MSWNFNYTAKSREDARQLTDAAYAPKLVKDFIKAAIDGIPDKPALASGADSIGIYCDTSGHLADGNANTYTTSTFKAEVKPLYLSEPEVPKQNIGAKP